jgi:hypothetical protein
MTRWMIRRRSQGKRAAMATISRRWTILTSSVRARRRSRISRFVRLIQLSWRRLRRMTTRIWRCTFMSTSIAICMCTTRLFWDRIPCVLSGCLRGKAKSLTWWSWEPSYPKLSFGILTPKIASRSLCLAPTMQISKTNSLRNLKSSLKPRE